MWFRIDRNRIGGGVQISSSAYAGANRWEYRGSAQFALESAHQHVARFYRQFPGHNVMCYLYPEYLLLTDDPTVHTPLFTVTNERDLYLQLKPYLMMFAGG